MRSGSRGAGENELSIAAGGRAEGRNLVSATAVSDAAEVRGRAHARAALLGNPSDGYGGQVIAVVVRNFAAKVTVRPSARADGPPPAAARLIAAAQARFRKRYGCPPVPLAEGAFSLRTEIPREVGLAGSSAIVIATMRALAELEAVEIAPAELARLALAAETEELGITAGLQDRVAQAYEGLVAMDFAAGAGDAFELLDPGLLPPLFVAYRADASQPSSAVHARLRRRFEEGDELVVETMREIAALAQRGREALLARDHPELGRLMRANVNARARIVDLNPRHLRMVELADAHGAPSNYAGSGGAIVGLLPERRAEELRAAFASEGCRMIVPRVWE
jgi:glucuronokinase